MLDPQAPKKTEQATMSVTPFRPATAEKPKKPLPVNHTAEIEELDLPPPERMVPEELLMALARSVADGYSNCMIVMTRQNDDEEEMSIYAAGPDISRERMVWMAEKVKLRCFGFDVGSSEGSV